MQSERSLKKEILKKFYKEIPITITNGLFKYPKTTKKDSITLVEKYDNETLLEAKNYLEPMFEIHRKYDEQIKTANKVNKYIRIEPYELIYLAYPKSKKDDDPDSRHYEISKNLKQLSKIVKHKITWISNEESRELSILNVIDEGKYYEFSLMESFYNEFFKEICNMKNNELMQHFHYMVKIHRTKQCITYLTFCIVQEIMNNTFKDDIEKKICNKGNIIELIQEYKKKGDFFYLSYENTLRLIEVIELLYLYESIDYYHYEAYLKIIELAEKYNIDEYKTETLYYDFCRLDTNAIIFYIGEILGAKSKLNKIPMHMDYYDEEGNWYTEKEESDVCYPCSIIHEFEE